MAEDSGGFDQEGFDLAEVRYRLLRLIAIQLDAPLLPEQEAEYVRLLRRERELLNRHDPRGGS
jgi:hypothetical protein